MRGFLTFAMIMIVGAAVAALVHLACPTFGAGYATGVVFMMVAALVVNTFAGERS